MSFSRRIGFFIAGAATMAALTAAQARSAVIANVGSKSITEEEIKAGYEAMSKEQRKAVNDDAVTRRNIIDNAVNAEMLVQAAAKAGMDKSEEYNKAFEQFRKQYLASTFMRKAIEPKLNKAEIKKWYEDNKQFFDSTQVCAHHIVVQEEATASKLAEQAKAKGAKFEELAKKSSIDPTVQENKGNLGCFTRDRMVPEFAAAAFAMRKGEVRGPVRSMYGYHVIQVDDIKPGKTPGFEEVEQRAKDAYRLKLVQDLISDLRSKSNVKVDEDAVQKFRL